MPEPVLWPIELHTIAKHQVLRAYVEAWIPVMGHQALRVRRTDGKAARLLLVDGFAGPGRYEGGEPGSPLILLDVLLEHRDFERLSGVEFHLLFIEQDERRVEHLRGELAGLGELPDNVRVHLVHGAFEARMGKLIDEVTGSGRTLIPTFTFIDPFGYTGASMSLTGRLLDFPRSEILVFLPFSFVYRFAGRAGQENALDSLFGCPDWRDGKLLSGARRRKFLLRLFERQLASHESVEHVRSFQLKTGDGNDYRLVFGLGHQKGLEIAKDAMWKADPTSGTSYSALTDSGELVLFGPEELLDTSPLLAELRDIFGTRWFTIDEAEECTLLRTPFKKGHLRRRTLQPAERKGVLKVKRPGSHGFQGARMRLIE